MGFSLMLLGLLNMLTTCRRIFTHMQQTAIENIVAKVEITQNDKFLTCCMWERISNFQTSVIFSK